MRSNMKLKAAARSRTRRAVEMIRLRAIAKWERGKEVEVQMKPVMGSRVLDVETVVDEEGEEQHERSSES
jgi:hypothetical protein